MGLLFAPFSQLAIRRCVLGPFVKLGTAARLRFAAAQVFPQGGLQPLLPLRLSLGFAVAAHSVPCRGAIRSDACAPKGLMASITAFRAAFRGRFQPPVSCRSSVVEHSLGKGEVHSSILCGSTTSLSDQRPQRSLNLLAPDYGLEARGGFPPPRGRTARPAPLESLARLSW